MAKCREVPLTTVRIAASWQVSLRAGGRQFDHEVEFGRLLALLDRAINMRRLRQTVFWPQVKPRSELVLSRARIVDRR
jgi:hypothetical protein